MKKKFSIAYLFWLATCPIMSFAQPIPADSAYLGQTPPGNTPKIFKLSVTPGYFASERVSISKNGKIIYYQETNGYSSNSSQRIKYYKYDSESWTGPFVLFEGFGPPALSVTGDTLYCQKGSDSYYSVNNGSSWSNPKKFSSKLNTAHYLQVTNSGNFYVSSKPEIGIGGKEWCKLIIDEADTTAISLGLPLNSSGDELDFFISNDESYIIISASSSLKISYRKKDGTWTKSKDLGAKINFGLGMWGPFVSYDNKYLFYSTGTKSDYSDTYVYWVRIDNIIDSLKQTNFIPYVKNKIPNQTDTVGQLYNYTLPDSTFIDDDGNNTIMYSAKLINGNPLPSWLSFNPSTCNFSGTPAEAGSLTIKVTATDNDKATVSATFTLKVAGPNSIQQTFEQNIEVFPNPTTGIINISFGSLIYLNAAVKIANTDGKVIFTNTFHNNPFATIDLSGNSKGVYILSMVIDGDEISKKLVIE